jgi:hypothetical protein
LAGVVTDRLGGAFLFDHVPFGGVTRGDS